MLVSYPSVITKQYQIEAKKWLEEIVNGESLSIMFVPKTDRLRRIQQLIEDQQILQGVLDPDITYLFEILDININLVEDRFDLEENLARLLNYRRITTAPQSFEQWISYLTKRNIRLVLILPETEKFLRLGDNSILTILTYLISDYSSVISVISLYETDITHPKYAALLPSSTLLYETMFYYPLYGKTDTAGFIGYLEHKWKIEISKQVKEKIITDCGGHFWLVKETVREWMKHKTWSATEEGMMFRLQTMYDRLLTSEQSLLSNLPMQKKSLSQLEKHSLTYLRKMNFLDNKNRVTIQLLDASGIIKNLHDNRLIVKDNQLYFNSIPLEKLVSKKEYRVLKLLILTKGIVNRDQIAVSLWPIDTHEHYSDWAIDQIMARVRKKLTEIGISKNPIQVVRGKGYQFKS